MVSLDVTEFRAVVALVPVGYVLVTGDVTVSVATSHALAASGESALKWSVTANLEVIVSCAVTLTCSSVLTVSLAARSSVKLMESTSWFPCTGLGGMEEASEEETWYSTLEGVESGVTECYEYDTANCASGSGECSAVSSTSLCSVTARSDV